MCNHFPPLIAIALLNNPKIARNSHSCCQILPPLQVVEKTVQKQWFTVGSVQFEVAKKWFKEIVI